MHYAPLGVSVGICPKISSPVIVFLSTNMNHLSEGADSNPKDVKNTKTDTVVGRCSTITHLARFSSTIKHRFRPMRQSLPNKHSSVKLHFVDFLYGSIEQITESSHQRPTKNPSQKLNLQPGLALVRTIRMESPRQTLDACKEWLAHFYSTCVYTGLTNFIQICGHSRLIMPYTSTTTCRRKEKPACRRLKRSSVAPRSVVDLYDA